MNITDVRIRPVQEGGKVKAIASITLEDCFVIHDLKVVEGENGLFVAMPARKGPDGIFRDIAHPIEQETRRTISRLVIERYEARMKEMEAEKPEETV